jgi:bifunctional non-homologous end joining protein LigD
MPLDRYAKKRNFDVTPEPPPGQPKPAGPGPATFMIHKHDARRLHYDLRLEIDGALASWAIPRGPCFDPMEKRLAVQTEDHPIEYGGFEGRIPEGEYGAGDAIIWDRGVYETVPPGQASAMRKKGHVDLILLGEKLKGRWHLVRTGGRGAGAVSDGPKSQWLFFKAQDEFADPAHDVVAERPESVASGRRLTRGPTAAAVKKSSTTPIELLLKVWPPAAIEAGTRKKKGVIWESVPEGRRALAAVVQGRVALQSEEGRDLAGAHGPLVKALAQVAATEFVVDAWLQEGEQGETTGGGRLWVRDLLWLDGKDERARPLSERRELLEALLARADPRLRPAAWFDDRNAAAAASAARLVPREKAACLR